MPFPRTPALTVDCVAIDEAGRLLLIRRKHPGHTCSVAFLTRLSRARPRAGDDAAGAEWVERGSMLELAFDHARIVADAAQAEEEACVSRGSVLAPPPLARGLAPVWRKRSVNGLTVGHLEWEEEHG
jgi:ADP-ribose pyrophosphatase YjhB (NUDIX family)